jgi:hypothetical protein
MTNVGERGIWRLALTVVAAVSTVGVFGVSLLEASTTAEASNVVAAITANPDAGVLDGTAVAVSGTAPSNVKSVVIIECDMTQSNMVGQPYDATHCDTSAADDVTLPVTNNAFSGSFVFHDPLTTPATGAESCAGGCVLLADNPNPGDVSSETMVSGNSCNGVFNGSPAGSLVKTTSAGPNDSTVSPGQTITVTLTWNPADFGGNAPSKTDDCVEIGSSLSASLSQEDKPGPAGGTDTYTYTVPSGGTNGQQICDRGAVSGTGHSGEKSAILCYTVMGVETPEVSQAVLLPVAGLFVGGGVLLLVRRRRTGTSSAD